MKRFYRILPLFFIATAVSSCLKDDGVIGPEAPGYISNIVEFYNETPPISGTTAPYIVYNPKALESVEEEVFTATISYSGAEVAPQDITVQLAPAPEAAETAGYEQLPSSTYEMPTSVVIKKGEKRAQISIKVKPLELDVDISNALGIAITSSSLGTISGNFGTVVFSLPVKNEWDGIYTIEEGSYVQRYASPGNPTTGDALNGSLAGNPNIALATMGSTSLEIGNMTWAGGTSGVAGIDNTRITIDPSTNQVTMSAVGNATLANRAGMVNEYDPDTKTFTLNFDWNQTTAPREMTLILKYSGSR